MWPSTATAVSTAISAIRPGSSTGNPPPTAERPAPSATRIAPPADSASAAAVSVQGRFDRRTCRGWAGATIDAIPESEGRATESVSPLTGRGRCGALPVAASFSTSAGARSLPSRRRARCLFGERGGALSEGSIEDRHAEHGSTVPKAALCRRYPRARARNARAAWSEVLPTRDRPAAWCRAAAGT